MQKIYIKIGFLITLVFVIIFAPRIIREQKSIEETMTQPVDEELSVEQTISEPLKNFSLEGSWVWIGSVDSKDEAILPDDPYQFELIFETQGKLNSTTDCNTISGSYITNEESISIGPLASTKMACEGTTLEAIYANQLASASTYTIDGSVLRIDMIKGAGIMTFNRKQ